MRGAVGKGIFASSTSKSSPHTLILTQYLFSGKYHSVVQVTLQRRNENSPYHIRVLRHKRVHLDGWKNNETRDYHSGEPKP